MSSDPSKIQGEGDYVSAKKFQDAEHKFVEEGRVDDAAREAEEALDGPEGEALETARRVSAEGHSLPKGAGGQAEHKLDKALADSFPASDPMPASPGSD